MATRPHHWVTLLRHINVHREHSLDRNAKAAECTTRYHQHLVLVNSHRQLNRIATKPRPHSTPKFLFLGIQSPVMHMGSCKPQTAVGQSARVWLTLRPYLKRDVAALT